MTDLHNELPLAHGAHTCACGGHDDTFPELDARAIPHAIRHASIFGAVDSLAVNAGLILIAPHDPLPLLAQARDRYGEDVSVEYLQRGPDAWRLRFVRVG